MLKAVVINLSRRYTDLCVQENLILKHNGEIQRKIGVFMQVPKVLKKLFFIVCLFSFGCNSLAAEMIHSSSGLHTKPHERSSEQTFNKPVIMLDAGHGGRDEGTKVHSFKEKKITLATVLYTKKFLEQMGYRVILTRSKDVEISLHRRVALANKTQSALFVSIHYNASRNTDAKGVEIFYYDSKDPERAKKSRKLANYILHYVIDQTEANSRGVKVGNFHVIRETDMPAVLLEGGFVTNIQECSHLRRKEYLENIAKGVAQGIDKFLKS